MEPGELLEFSVLSQTGDNQYEVEVVRRALGGGRDKPWRGEMTAEQVGKLQREAGAA